MQKILGILGPTAVGKTKIAKILAQKTNQDTIISADSMQIYQELNVGTAKATPEEMSGIAQLMTDIVQPTDSFSSYDYAKLTSNIIEQMFSADKIPIIVGGTGFYFDSLLYPLTYSNDNVEKIREQLNNQLKTFGIDYLYNKLLEIDEESAKTIHPNNTVRVIRALEIFYSTGQKKSDFKLPTDSKYPANLYVLTTDRQTLYQKINKRVDKMIADGLLNEVKSLTSKYSPQNQCFNAIGYKEIIAHLNGDYDLNTAIEKIKQNTRNYAKRQISYFKRFKKATWIEVNYFDPTQTADKILKDFFENDH